VPAVKARGASLKAAEQPIDTGTAAGKCFLDMLGVFAEFETNLRKERQLEGIAKAKAAGVYKGRPASIDAARVRELKGRGPAHGDRQGTGHRPGECLLGAGSGPVIAGSASVMASRPEPIRPMTLGTTRGHGMRGLFKRSETEVNAQDSAAPYRHHCTQATNKSRMSLPCQRIGEK
jgi:hypothetical protein